MPDISVNADVGPRWAPDNLPSVIVLIPEIAVIGVLVVALMLWSRSLGM